MPNWCANNVTLTHEDPEMIRRAAEAFSGGNLLAEFIPLPHGKWDYTWCIENWGTKWDIGGPNETLNTLGPDRIEIAFDSAWSPPITAYEALTEMGFGIDATYYEPGMAFCGVWQDGYHDTYEYANMSAAEIRESIPSELDERYSISEWVEESENEEFLEDEEYSEDQDDSDASQ